MRLSSAVAVLLLSATSVALAQTILPVPADGDNTVNIVIAAPVVAGNAISIQSATTTTGCATSTNVLPFVANSNSVVLAGAMTTVTLKDKLKQGEIICASFKNAAGAAVGTPTPAVTVGAPASPPVSDWGLVRAYFTGGVVIANDSSNFSSAYQFYELNVDKTWILPGCPGCNAAVPQGAGPGNTTLKLVASDTYEIWGEHIQVNGAILNGSVLAPIDSAAGIVVSGRFLKIVHVVSPTNKVIVLHINGTITIQQGTVDYNVNKMAKISDGTVKLLKGGSVGVRGAATLIFGGSVLSSAPSHQHGIGFNSFFDSRLTAIPVSSNPTNTVTAATTTAPSTTPATTPSFINTQKTALLAVGVYAPIPLTNWIWNTKQNALFIAPMAKIGFNTLTGATSQNVVLPDSTTSPNTGTETYAQLYNFRTYGARIGHMQYSGSPNQAPEVYSYIDIGFGPYSNLESLICNRTLYNNASSTTPFGPATGQPTATGYTGNGCQGAYPDYYQSPSTSQTYFPYETRKRIYRLDFEGLLQIPGTAFYVGFNANLGQKAVLAGRYDPAFKAPDDLRFFFGTKFDISTVLTKLGVNLGN